MMDYGGGDAHTDNSVNSQAEQADNFKPIFKKYKRRDQPLDLTDVIDFETNVDSSSNSVRRVNPITPSLTPIVGLKPVQDWAIFRFLHHPGFYVIQNPFVAGSQRYWTSRCLEDLPRPPNVTNLTVHPDLHPDTLWTSFLNDFHHRGCEAYNSSSPLRKLRWTTIGYHYHWDTKEYREEDHTPFPEDIGAVAHYVACAVGFPQFRAEAGIVNYYHHDSSLAAHTDHSELDHEAPLVSISFGQDALFLLGGRTKALAPTALRLHSGDICVMSGEARLAYHAVPRILPPSPSSSSSSSSSCTPTLPHCFDLTPDDWKTVESWTAAGVEDIPGDTPDGVGDTPGGVGDTPGDIRDTPGGIGDMPGGIRDTPGDIRDIPGGIGDIPGDIRETPGGIGDIPGDIRDTPGDIRDTPGDTPGPIVYAESPPDESNSFSATTDNSNCVSAPAKRHTQSCVPEQNSSLSSATGDISAQHTKSSSSSSSSQESVSVASCGDSASSEPTTTHHTEWQGTGDSHTDGGLISTATRQQQQAWKTEDPERHGGSQTAWYEDAVKAVNRRLVGTLQRRGQDWGPFATYLSSSRLNLNIRQVLKAGGTFDGGTVGGGGGGGGGVGVGWLDSSAAVQVKKARTETSPTS